MRSPCHLIDLTCEPSLGSYSLALGYLQAAAESDRELAGEYSFHRHVMTQSADFAALSRQVLDTFAVEPRVVCFSLYFWNRRPSLAVAHAIKERWPACTIVLGGNDVSFGQERAFVEAPWVDVVAHGEGEAVFCELLRALRDRQGLGGVRGISFRADDGEIVTNPPAERIVDLDRYPSPLLSGLWSREALRDCRMVIVETNRGCPFECAFCYWGVATKSKVRQFPLERIKAEIDFLTERLDNYSTIYVADANFGMLKRDLEIAEYLAESVSRANKRLIMATNWAKNTDANVVSTVRLLFKHRLIGAMTLSAQSFDREVLKVANRRNIAAAYYMRLQKALHEEGIPTYTELIWGMPGETLATFKSGIEEVLRTGGTPIIYPLLLLNNTDYARPELRQAHAIQSRWLPYRLRNPETLGEVVVGHSAMSEEDWLEGLSFSLAMSLFAKSLMPAVLWYVHQTTGIRFVDMIETLRAYLASDACAVPRLTTLFRNYVDCYVDHANFDDPSISGEIGASRYVDNLHYQAFMAHLIRDQGNIVTLVRAAAGQLYASLPKEARPSREEFAAVVEFQARLLTAWQAFIRRTTVELELSLPAAALRVLLDCNQLVVEGSPPPDGDVRFALRVVPGFQPWDAKLMGVFYGTTPLPRWFGPLRIENAGGRSAALAVGGGAA